MEGGPLSKGGSRLSAVHTGLKTLQQLHGWRAVRLQNVALVFAPVMFVLNCCNSFTDGGRPVYKMWLSFLRRAHSSEIFARASLMEDRTFSN
eukprot:4374581-Pyramimonas_sp.AAC.1